MLAWISWLAGSGAWLPDDDFDDALLDVGEEPRDWDDRPGRPPDAATAAAQMRRAGYAEVRARAGIAWSTRSTSDGAVGFLTEFDEDDLVASLGERRPAFEAPSVGGFGGGRPELALGERDGHGPRHPPLTRSSATRRGGARGSALGGVLRVALAAPPSPLGPRPRPASPSTASAATVSGSSSTRGAWTLATISSGSLGG